MFLQKKLYGKKNNTVLVSKPEKPAEINTGEGIIEMKKSTEKQLEKSGNKPLYKKKRNKEDYITVRF